MNYDRIIRLFSSVIDDVFHNKVNRGTEEDLFYALAEMVGDSNVMVNLIFDDYDSRIIGLTCRVRYASSGKWENYVIWKEGDIE